jgi:citrate lyase subunit alpha/citrate CoA-transferase
MRNAVGREIPNYVEGYGVPALFEGAYGNIGGQVRKAPVRRIAPKVDKSPFGHSKLLSGIEEAIDRCGLKSGMTVSFHHHLRNGDYVTNMVMKAIAEKGLNDIHVAASGLFKCHEPLVPLIEEGIISKITLSTISPGPLAKAITYGKLKYPAVFMSHGARPEAIESGRLHIDVAFIAAPVCDAYGNMNGVSGKSACGCLSYAYADAEYADYVVAITDNLVEYPACPIEISQDKVDYVVCVPEIGDPNGIAFGPTKPTTQPENLAIAKLTADMLDAAGYIKDGFSIQTGAGGTSLAVAAEVEEIMKKKGVKGSFGMGGITSFFVKMLHEGLLKSLLDVQCFDKDAIASARDDPRHMIISASQYANPANCGCAVNQLDIMILGATEVDLNFNVNVVTGSNGVILSSSGGNNDCAAGSKISVVVTNLNKRGRCVIRDEVMTVTTPGETVDVIVTEAGIAVNPKREDLQDALKDSGLPLMDIHEMKRLGDSKADQIDAVTFGEKIVVVVEYRDGTVIDVVRQII